MILVAGAGHRRLAPAVTLPVRSRLNQPSNQLGGLPIVERYPTSLNAVRK